MPRNLEMSVHIEEWAAKQPFRITGHLWESFPVVVVEISDGKHQGRGEGLPIYYLNETANTLYKQVEAARPEICRGVTRESLLSVLPPGGARNAVDSALWDLEAKSSGKSVWELTGIQAEPVTTAFTIGIEPSTELMAARAREAAPFPVLKIKLDHVSPVERIAAIRAARPDATLTVDANQGWTFEQLVAVAPKLAALGVQLIEQPLARGSDHELEAYDSPVPLCADESCQNRSELDQVARRYQIVNIKLDKAGGLTEALLLAHAARKRGLELLVGNMCGTSLSMAPAYVLSQLCQYAELDGQLLLAHDRLYGLQCMNGRIATLDNRLWG